ncbi:MAG: hypothetical protein IKG86_07580 [Paludibacteraceae bacterium]|nr:hypothetical protein [Paludibacteraceae bacterium]
MEQKFEKVYSLTFDTQEKAAEVLDSMQYTYKSALYNYHMGGQFTPNQFIVTFPEGAKSLLSEELQNQATECVFPFQGGYFIPTVYRFIEEQYVDAYLETGTLQLTTFKRCGKLEDPLRKDGMEGECTIVGVSEGMTMETHMRMGDEALMLCTSLAAQYVDKNGEKCNCALEIFDVGGFVNACSKAIIAKGYHIKNVQIGPCFYSKKTIYGELMEEEVKKMGKNENLTLEDIFAIPQRVAGPKAFFQKPIEKASEMEYRMVWLVYPNPQEDTLLIQVENPKKYARKISL